MMQKDEIFIFFSFFFLVLIFITAYIDDLFCDKEFIYMIAYSMVIPYSVVWSR